MAEKADDTVYYDYDAENPTTPLWNEQIPSVKEEESAVEVKKPTQIEEPLTVMEEEQPFRVIRRRSRSVGSRPLFHQNKQTPPTNNSQ